jgi:putative glycosyltransferase (TIGR04372 family)
MLLVLIQDGPQTRTFSPEKGSLMIYKIRLAINSTIQRLIIALLILKRRQRQSFPSKLLATNLGLTETLRIAETNKLESKLRRISQAYQSDHEGLYFQARAIRKTLLEGIYFDAEASKEYFPPLLGRSWTKFIGHLSVLALHSKAQNLGMVPSGRRYLLISEGVASEALVKLIGGDYVPLVDPYLSNLELFPPTQVLYENYHSIKTSKGFQETHAFIESVFTENQKQNESKSIISKSLVDKQVDQLSKKLMTSKVQRPYVAVHLRNSGRKERRDVNPETYFDAFKQIILNGYQIVNIGPEIISSSTVEIVNISDRSLHPFVMANAQFAITSTSGPSLLPSLFGTPNLVTNLTSIGRNMINCNDSTFYLPKKIFRGTSKLGYKDILNTSIAYDEREEHEFSSEEMRIVDNSREEINMACLWMLNSISANDFSFDPKIALNVKSIQEENKSVTRGHLIPTYLDSNPNFLS